MIDLTKVVQPNAEMLRLRDMLDEAGIEWEDNSDFIMCRTQRRSEDGEWDYSAICGFGAYGAIELWTRDMRIRKEDPVGLNTAEDAFELIRKQVGA